MKHFLGAMAVAVLSTSATASDHLDSAFLDEFPQWDIGDLFLWTGEETGSPVFAMTFNPLTGTRDNTEDLHLDPKAVYQFKIDTDNDLKADIAYKFTVSGDTPQQSLTLWRATGEQARTNSVGEYSTSTVVAKGDTTVGYDAVKVIEGSNGELAFIGPRQDPFYFNFESVESPVALGLRFALGADGLPSDGTSKNTFGPTNMTFVALEVPELKGKKFNAWSTTSVNGRQVDRAARAAITAIFTPNTPPGRNDARYPWRKKDFEAPKQLYNMSIPSEDKDLWTEMVRYRLNQVQVQDKDLEPLIDFFLPDVLEYDPNTNETGYPNGRNLKEDVVYWTINKINPFLHHDPKKKFPTTSKQPLSNSFPYAASPVPFKK